MYKYEELPINVNYKCKWNISTINFSIYDLISYKNNELNIIRINEINILKFYVAINRQVPII